MKKESSMDTYDKTDDMLFTPLTSREASVSLAELQRYVSSKPVPAEPNRMYVAAAIATVCVVLGIVFLSGGDSATVPTIAEKPSAKQIVPHVSAPQAAVNADPVATPERKLYGKQRTRQLRQTVSVTKTPLVSDQNLGLMEKSLPPDLNVVGSQQFAMECNELSFFVALARIEFPDLQEPQID
jgi:hypothetical protein